MSTTAVGRTLSLLPIKTAQREPKPLTTDVAKRVFDARPVNELLFKFMPIPDQDRMKGVSRVCLATAERVQREKYFQEISQALNANCNEVEVTVFWNLLTKTHVRNFPAPIQQPLSQFPDFMIGYEKTHKGFTTYILNRKETFVRSCFPCLPDWTMFKQTQLSRDSALDAIHEYESGNCVPDLPEDNCLSRCWFFTRSCLLSCLSFCLYQQLWNRSGSDAQAVQLRGTLLLKPPTLERTKTEAADSASASKDAKEQKDDGKI